MKIIVLAGGTGQRLWPLSRTVSPKQVLPVFGKKTMLQQTISRLLKKFKTSDIFIVTGKEYRKSITKQLPHFPKKNILTEPVRRNTAAAIGFAVYKIAQKNPKEIVISIASDHYINPENKFLSALAEMAQVIEKNPKGVCFMGIKPSYPATGYGYLELGPTSSLLSNGKLRIAKRFIEKPTLKKAKTLVRSKKYLWNPSYFAWRADNFTSLMAKYSPKTHQLLKKTVNGSEQSFKKIPPQPVEYAILEKLRKDIYVLPVDFQWADIGHWASVREIQAKKSSANVTLGLQHNYDTKGSLIYNYSDNLLTTVGVEGLIIVQTPDGTLVCSTERAEDVKKLVEQMRKAKKLKKFL